MKLTYSNGIDLQQETVLSSATFRQEDESKIMISKRISTMKSNKSTQFVTLMALSLMVAGPLVLLMGSNGVNALSLISEKCDPNKVGPDETTVKGGWQAEMFNGLAFRTCGKFCSI